MSEVNISSNGSGDVSQKAGKGGRAWAWGVAVVYTTFALMAVSFAIFASGQSVGLVSSDYYQRSEKHQQHMENAQRAQALPVGIEWSARALPNGMVCSFPVEKMGAVPSGTIQLYRPDDARLDRHFAIDIAQGEQRLLTGPLKSGLGRVRFEWAAGGSDYFQEVVLEVA